MEHKKLKVGIIGANWTLNYHTPVWRMVPDVEVVAVCTAHTDTAEAAAREFNIPKAYSDYREMARDPDIDIISVGSSPDTRYGMVIAALEGGKHVYNCIPFAVDAAKAKHMRDLQRAKGRVGVVDAQWRWSPAMQQMKEMIAQGALGEFFTANIHLQLPFFDYDGFRYSIVQMSPTANRAYMWTTQASSGASAWRNFGMHTTLNLMHFFGEVEEAVGITETFVKDFHFPDGTRVRPQTADHGMALLRFKNGGIANIHVSWAAADGPGYFLQVMGSKGRFVARDSDLCFCDASSTTLFYGDTRLRDHMGERGSLVELPDRFFEVPGTPFSKSNAPMYKIPLSWMFRDMARVIRTGSGDGSPSFDEAYHAQCVVEAVEQSWKTRRWVRISDVQGALENP